MSRSWVVSRSESPGPCGSFREAAAEGNGDRTGHLVEFDLTTKIFSNPSDSRTEDYISGRFG